MSFTIWSLDVRSLNPPSMMAMSESSAANGIPNRPSSREPYRYSLAAFGGKPRIRFIKGLIESSMHRHSVFVRVCVQGVNTKCSTYPNASDKENIAKDFKTVPCNRYVITIKRI